MSRRLLLVVGGTTLVLTLFLAVVGVGAFVLLRRPAEPQLLIVGGDSHLRMLRADNELRDLAGDLSTDLFRYPVPSPDGRLVAYVASDAQGSALRLIDLASGAGREVYRSASNPPMYITWSPDSQYLSFLITVKDAGLHTHVVPADGSRPSELITAESPSYFVWSPDSSTLLLHIGGSGVEGGRIQTYRPGGSPQSILNDPALFFRTVDWSADGTHLLYVAQQRVTGELTEAQIESVITRVAPDGSGAEPLVREKRALVFFMRSPADDSLAYVKLSSSERALYVWDAASSQPRRLSGEADVVTEFFWAPDGRTIAYLTLVETPAVSEVRNRRWHLVDVASGAVRDLEPFTPSPSFEAMLQFFDAYALAFDLWSADSTRLVYGAEDGVYLLDAASGSQSRVGDGALGMWVQAE